MESVDKIKLNKVSVDSYMQPNAMTGGTCSSTRGELE